MDAYIITLKDETAPEIEDLKATVSGFGFRPLIFRGVDGRTVGCDVAGKHCDRGVVDFLTEPTVGIALSHLFVWKQIVESGVEQALVLEDDVVFVDNFAREWRETSEQVPSNFDVLYLGCFGCTEKIDPVVMMAASLQATKGEYKVINARIAEPRCALAAHAYVVSRKGARKLIRHLDGRIYFHIDYCINNLFARGKINAYVTNPRLAFQTSTDGMGSTNVSSHHPLLLTRLMSKFHIDQGVRLSYMSTVSVGRLGVIPIGVMSFLFFMLGCVLAIVGVKTKNVAFVFVAVSSLDVASCGTFQDVAVIVLHFVLIVLPSVLWGLMRQTFG